MNLLDGARYANRKMALATVSAAAQTGVAIGAATSVFSIGQVIENKRDIIQERALRNAAHEIRRIAFAAVKEEKRNHFLLAEAEVSALEGLGSAAKMLITKGLTTVGSWFIRTIMMGVRGVVVPMFRLLATATGFVLRTIFTNPIALGVLAASGAAYALYHKLKKPEPEPIKPYDNRVPRSSSDVEPPAAPAKSTAGGGRGTQGVERQRFEPAVMQPATEQPALSIPRATQAGAQPVVAGTTSNGLNVYVVPGATTATAAPTEVLDSKGRKRDKVPFGILNNNPGNIEFRNQAGAKLYSPNPDKPGRFAIFPSQEEGLYQIGRQMQLYDSRGVSTIRKMLEKYAPPTENKTNDYIDFVAKLSGYDPDKPVDMTDPKLVSALIKAVVRKEVGTAPYTDAQYTEAALRSMAFRNNKYMDQSFGLQIPTYGRLSSTYGNRVDPVTGAFERKHKGIDIATPKGTPVYAATDGKAVVQPDTKGGYGNLLDILGDKYNTRYAHLDSFDVKDGEQVKSGQVVARVGNTGRSTGNHLHFEVRDKKDNDINPATVMALPPKTIEKANVVPVAPSKEPVYLQSQGKTIRLENT